MSVKIAMVQLRVDFKKEEENFGRAEKEIAKAAQSGCCCAVLPECFDIGWGLPGALGYAQGIPGPRTERLGRLAREYGIALVAGLTEKEGGRCYNTAVLLSRDGTLLGKHRKINVLHGVEDMVYARGDRLGVYETEFGRVGVNICADNLWPHLALGRGLAAMGAKMILSPCAWAVPPEDAAAKKPYGETWLTPYTALAREYGLWVVGVSNVGDVSEGVWAGWKCIGNSIAVSPGGAALTMEYGEDAQSTGVVIIAES